MSASGSVSASDPVSAPSELLAALLVSTSITPSLSVVSLSASVVPSESEPLSEGLLSRGEVVYELRIAFSQSGSGGGG